MFTVLASVLLILGIKYIHTQSEHENSIKYFGILLPKEENDSIGSFQPEKGGSMSGFRMSVQHVHPF